MAAQQTLLRSRLPRALRSARRSSLLTPRRPSSVAAVSPVPSTNTPPSPPSSASDPSSSALLPVRPPYSSQPPPLRSTTHRLVVSALLSRPPLVLPPLHPLERAYFAYQRGIRKAVERKPESGFYFREGSKAEVGFREALERGEGSGSVQGVDVREALAGGAAGEVREEGKAGGKAGGKGKEDLRSLERMRDRTLYLMVKKRRKEHQWQFPQGGLEPGESLSDGALRELHEELGPNMDVWSIGRVPAAYFAYAGAPEGLRSKYPDGTRVWYMPQRILRGQAQITEVGKKEGLEEFAWLVREEIEERVPREMWEALEPVLSE